MPRFALAAVATLLVATSVHAQSFVPGDYRLAGTAPDGRASAVRLQVRAEQGAWVIERRAERAGERLRWEARATRVEARALEVTFTPSAPGGAFHVFEARYELDRSGREIREVLLNRTRLAPEDGWDRLETQGQRSLAGLSLGELARATIPPLFSELSQGLQAFGPQTLPHQAKELRKQIGEVRLYVDLFSYAYPRGAGFDPWSDLREALDEGYEAMGHFKDLYDAQGVADPAQAVYDAAELDQARAPVLRWLADFARPNLIGFYAHYLATPKKRRLTERSDLSRYFWGVRGCEPRSSRSGLENLAELQRALLAQAREDLEQVRRIADDDLIHVDEQEHFHDFRKALRSSVKLAEAFPETFQAGVDPAAEVSFADEVVGRFGDLNDLLVAHGLAERRGRQAEARRLAERVEADWDDLKAWLRAERTDERLRDLRRLVLDP